MASTSQREVDNLASALADLRENEVLAIVQKRLEAGESPMTILAELREGVSMVGHRFEIGEYFLSELIVGGHIFKKAFEVIKPSLATHPTKSVGKFVIGTVEGDIHDLGKDIVAVMLECNGFKVYDLGVDVPPQKFVEKTKEVNAELVGLSALITAGIHSMKRTVEEFEKSGIRSKVKIIIGGGIADEFLMRQLGADAYAKDANMAVKVAREMLHSK